MTDPQTQYPNGPRVAVGAVVFNKGRVLLVQRGKPPSCGLWAIPGGSVKLGETLAQAAERETLEETGIVVAAKTPVLTFDLVERDDSGRVRFHYVIVDLLADYISGEPRAGDDAVGVRWMEADELAEWPVNASTLSLLHHTFQFGGR